LEVGRKGTIYRLTGGRIVGPRSAGFAYASRRRMLKLGSLGYASYFIAGLPMARRIDSGGVRWTLERVVIEALATCMMILALLEVWAKTVGPL